MPHTEATTRSAPVVNRAIAFAVATIVASTARASSEPVTPPLQELTVTAQKRLEDLQNVPASVAVLAAESLQQLLASSFDDYAKYLSSTGSQSFGSGRENLYMRGITNNTDGLHVGSQPTVAIYLDEQPVTTIGNNLDIHIYDISRVEQLPGPQGTLLGTSSMAGTLRIITNKPSTARFEAGYDLDANVKPAGGPGGSVEGYLNFPLSSNSAVRLVAFTERDGGYINNVPGPPETYPTSGLPRTNAALTRQHFNDITTSGGRMALRFDLDDSWTITPSVIGQSQTANGFSAYEPALGDLNVAAYFPEKNVDKWWQAALVVEGKLSNLDIIYAGGHLRRTVDNQFDYSQYSLDYDAYYFPYYGDFFVNDAGKLISPAQYLQATDLYGKVSHELRLSSTRDAAVGFIAGVFYQHQVDDVRDEFHVDGLASKRSISGYPGIYLLNDMSRVDRDRAMFGEIRYSPGHDLTLTAGVRAFSYDNTVYGFFGYAGDEQLCAPGSAASAGPGRPCINVDQRATGSGSTYKLNLSYRLDARRMLYATWSTGFRPGGINRSPDFAPYSPDSLTNYELGWKTEWLDQHLRLNGALFLERWKDPQFTVCGPGCIHEVINAGAAQSRGLEAQLDWSTEPALTLSASATWLDAKLTANACRYGETGAICNNSAGIPDPGVLPLAISGSPLPASKFKGSVMARHSFTVRNLAAYVQGALAGQSSLPTNLPAVDGGLQAGSAPGYASLDVLGGMARGGLLGEVYVKNVFDRRGQENRGLFCGLPTCNQLYVLPIPPRTIGISLRQRF
ncbi:MAG: TonB-dependent receptor [Proteobacteria bacterium]|nr:TonB-dependent receptor [Pseudomonadota bacterium]